MAERGLADVRVSVVVLTYNRRAEVLQTLARLLSLPETPPVVVVDNGSTDGTLEALRAYGSPRVRILGLPRNQGACGRNAGVEAVNTPYVAFCDDDTWWEPGSLREACDTLDRYPRIASVTASLVIEPEGRPDPINDVLARSPLPRGDLPGPSLMGFLAGASVFRCAAFHAAGGYDCRLFMGGEEALLALDLCTLGWRMVYLPSLLVHHAPSEARDTGERSILVWRNAIWVAWLRRSWLSALRASVRTLREARRQKCAAQVLAEALHGIAWIGRRRRVVPAWVEHRCQLIERGAS